MSFDPYSLPFLDPQRDRRVALFTAGVSGIGFYTVLHLYLHGYIIYICGRSKTRGLKSISELNKQAKCLVEQYSKEETRSRFLGELHFLEMDLSRLTSVLDAVSTFKSFENNLNLLVNNTGVSFSQYLKTTDNFELQLQTNYIAPFLLTMKLIPLMERTVDLRANIESPRIIYINSVAHKLVFKQFCLSSSFNYYPNFIFTWFRYAIAKTAGVHFMKMLALRNPRLVCLSAQPGIIMNPNNFACWTRLPIIGILFWCWFQFLALILGMSTEQGALSIFKCCMDPNITPKLDSGSDFNLFAKVQPSAVASNMDYAAQSWIWTSHQLEKRNIDVT